MVFALVGRKEEPRLVRGEELGGELALAIAPSAQRVYRDLIEFLGEQPRALTVDLVMAFPEHSGHPSYTDHGRYRVWRDQGQFMAP